MGSQGEEKEKREKMLILVADQASPGGRLVSKGQERLLGETHSLRW